MDAKRGLLLLATAFGLSWVPVAMVAAPGPAAWVALSGEAAHAGRFFATFSLSAAAGALLAGRAMERIGRRRALVIAYVLAAAGFAIAGVSVALREVAPFILGVVAIGLAAGAIGLTRLVAAELFAPEARARAVARVMLAATVGAVAGPLLLLALAPEVLWFAAPPLYLVGAALVARVPEPPRARAATADGDAPAIPRLPFAVGVAALVCAQGAMVTVMGVTGVELSRAGHGRAATSLVMALHFTGMFAFSLLAGRFADRVGRRAAILAGAATLATGGLTVALLAGPVGLAAGLFLVGVGWSFCYLGGTVLLADVIPAARRARTMGAIDLTTALLAAGTSLAGGAWYARYGIEGLGLAAIAVVAVAAALALLVRTPTRPRHA